MIAYTALQLQNIALSPISSSPGFHLFSLGLWQKFLQKLRPHPLQQNAEMNERSQI
ncbi:MAG: hypothetical protein ACI9UT_002248 [Flavobacteriales bacterium]